MADTPSWLAEYPEAAEKDWLNEYPEAKDEPFFDLSDTLSAAGQAVTGLPTTVPRAFRQLYEGLENPWERGEGYLKSQEAADAYQQELEAANLEAEKSGDISTMSRGMRQAGQSLGFSAGAMGAGLIASTPSAAAGRTIGGLAGPEGAVAGEIIGRGAGALASGYGAAYRMAGAQFLDDARKEIDAKFLQVTGELPNEQQQEEAYQELLPLAQAFGHAEAGPEAIGNLAMAGAGKYVFGLGRKTIEKLAASALGKTGAAAGALGTELAGETITGVEQNRIDSQKKDILEGRDPSELPSREMEDYLKSFKEVAPATLATMGLMSVAPATVKAASLIRGKPAEAAPTDDFAQRAAMEGAVGEATPVEVEGVVIATIPPESDMTPEDVLDFANSPEDMAMLARNGKITLPEVVEPIDGVDPAITEEMDARLAEGKASGLADQTLAELERQKAAQGAPAPTAEAPAPTAPVELPDVESGIIDARIDLPRLQAAIQQKPDGKTSGPRVTDVVANNDFAKNGGWKLHLSVTPENYQAVDEWLHKNHKGQYKLLSGGSPEEGSDFTVYVGHKDAANDLASKIESEIGNLLNPFESGPAKDAQFNAKVGGRFDVARTGNIKDVPWNYAGMSGVPFDETAMEAINNIGEAPKTREQFAAKAAPEIERINKQLVAKYGDRYTGSKTPAPVAEAPAPTAETLGVTAPLAPTLETPEGAARNADMLRQAAARVAGTERGPRVGLIPQPSVKLNLTPDETSGTGAAMKEENQQTESGVVHKAAVLSSINSKSSVSAEAVDTYKIALPEGYVKQGDLYVFKSPAATEGAVMPGGSAPAPATTLSRGKPRESIVFKTPVKTPLGEVVGYSWSSQLVEDVDNMGEPVLRRISNWEEATNNAETGRDIVHKFLIRKPDGTTSEVSLESTFGKMTDSDKKTIKAVVSAAKRLPFMRAELAELQDLQKQAEADYQRTQKLTPDPTKLELREPDVKWRAEKGDKVAYLGGVFIGFVESGNINAKGELANKAKFVYDNAWKWQGAQRKVQMTEAQKDRLKSLTRNVKKAEELLKSENVEVAKVITDEQPTSLAEAGPPAAEMKTPSATADQPAPISKEEPTNTQRGQRGRVAVGVPPRDTGATDTPKRPSLGSTGKQIIDAWRSLQGVQVAPGETVVGWDVNGGGTYAFINNKLVKLKRDNKGFESTYTDATDADWQEVSDALDRGALQVEVRKITGLGNYPKVDAGKTVKVLHQATGKPLQEFLDTPEGAAYEARMQKAVAERGPKESPAPQAQQPAPQRDTSKPEQMTPEEFASSERDPELPKNYVLSDGNGNFVTEEKNGWFRVWRLTGTHATLAGTVGFKGAEGLAKAKARLKEVSAERHEEKLQNGLRTKKPVSAAAVDAYGIKLPEGYVKQGDLYIFQPSSEKSDLGAGAATTPSTEPLKVTTPEAGKSPQTAKVATEWTPTVNAPAAFTANNGQKLVGTVQSIEGGKAVVSFSWNGQTQKATVRPDRLSSPVASLTDPPRYQYTQEQNTRKMAKHFPSAPGVHANHDFRKSFASMAKDASLSRIYRQIAKELSKMSAFANVDLHVVADENTRYAGEYSHSNGKSAIAVNLRQVGRGMVDALGTILHEALHHVTLAKVRDPQGAWENEVFNKLDTIREKVLEYAKEKGLYDRLDYELDTVEEFISALTNPNFQNFLASIPDSFSTGVSVGKFRSVLSEVFRLIAEWIKGEPVARGSTMEQYFTTVLATFETPHRAWDTGKLEALNAVQSGAQQATPESIRHAELEAKFNAGTITPEETAEARRLVGERAKAAGYDVGPVYHGTEQKGLTEFYGGWWSDTKKVTREFGSQRYSAYLKGPLADGDTLRQLYKEYNGTDIDQDSDEPLYDSEIGDAAMAGSKFQELVRSKGYQGIEVWDESNAETGMAYAVFEPNQIKSADPFTGVPLDQRFDEKSNDIRASRAEGRGYRSPTDMLAEAAQKARGETVGTKPQGLASMFNPQAKRPATGERKLLDMPQTINLPQADSKLIANAYREAVRGSSTQMAPLSTVYAQARLLQPGLTPETFLAQVQEGYDNGTLLLEGAGSQQEAAQSSLSLPGTPVGTAVRMMPAPQGTLKSKADDGEPPIIDIGGEAEPADGPEFAFTRARFAPPKPEDQMYQVHSDEEATKKAFAWINAVGPLRAADLLMADRAPSDMDLNVKNIVMGGLLKGFTEISIDPNASEDEKTVARATNQRLGKYRVRMNQDAARGMRQIGVQNGAVLQLIAPILAVEEVLADHGEKILEDQFEGGSEGAAPRVAGAAETATAEADERLENIIRRLMGSLRPKQTSVGALARMFRGMGQRDQIIDEVAKALMLKARGNVVAPERKTALANLVSSLKSTLAASVKGEKKPAPERTLQDLLTSAFVNQVSEGPAFESAWKEGRQKVLDMLIDMELDKTFHPAQKRLADLRAKLTYLEAGSAEQQEASAAERAQLADQIKVAKVETKAAMDAVKAMTPQLEAQRDALMPAAPTVAFDPVSSREAIGRAFEKAGYTADLATGLDKSGKRTLSIKDALLNRQRAADAVIKVFDAEMQVPDAATQNDWPQARALALKAVNETLDSWQAQTDADKVAKLEAAKQSLLSEDSKALEKLVNSIRNRILPDSDWSDILYDLPRTQAERLAAIKDRVAKHEALKNLTPDESKKLAESIDKLWQRERLKAFQDELFKAGVLKAKTTKAVANVASAAPELLRLMNLGVFNSSTFREAISKRFGLKLLTGVQADALRKLAAEAWGSPQGVLRNQKLGQLVEGIQHATGANWADVMNSYWIASVLSGLRTHFDTWGGVVNGLGTNLIQAGVQLSKGRGVAAFDIQAQWWKGLFTGLNEALYLLRTGDPSFTKRFEADLIDALNGEKTAHPIAIGEKMWKSGSLLQKIPGALMMVVGRSMVAADHVNNTATTQGAMAVARAMNPELYEGKTSWTQKEIADARKQAIAEATAGAEPATKFERMLVAKRTREILNAGLTEADQMAASEVGDIAAFQNDPTGLFGGLYHAVKSGLSSAVRSLDQVAQDEEAAKITRAFAAVTAGSVHALTGTRFMRFGFNLGNEFMRYMPGSWLLNKGTNILGSKLSPMQQDMLIGKNVVGGILLATLYSLFGDDDESEDGKWHMEGPWNDLSLGEQSSRLSAGLAKNSFWRRKDGKIERISYAQWPTAGLLAAVGSMLDEKRYKPEDWNQRGVAGHILQGAVTGLFQVQDAAAMQQVAELFSTSSSYGAAQGMPEKVIKMGTNYLGGLVPTSVKDLDKWQDPRNFRADGVWEKLVREMPVARRFVNDGRPQFNRIGQDVRLHREPYSRLYTTDEADKATVAYGQLLARGIDFPTPSTKRQIIKDGKKVPMDTLGKGVTYDFEKAVALSYGKFLQENGERITGMSTKALDKLIRDRATRILDIETRKVQAKVNNP